jgi:hypothetical protein
LTGLSKKTTRIQDKRFLRNPSLILGAKRLKEILSVAKAALFSGRWRYSAEMDWEENFNALAYVIPCCFANIIAGLSFAGKR